MDEKEHPTFNPNQALVHEFMRSIPHHKSMLRDIPEIPDLATRKLCARLLLEECLETIQEGLGLDVAIAGWSEERKYEPGIDDIKFTPSPEADPDVMLLADGLVDLEYVTHFTANACGISTRPIFGIIHQNNMLKIEKGTIGEDGKLIKHPAHPSPLMEIEEEMGGQGWKPETADQDSGSAKSPDSE